MPATANRDAILTLLGFDYGTQKIGVAVGQSLTATASPLGSIRARAGKPDWEAISTLVTAWRPGAFVVGLPLNMDGTESEMSARARRFANQLQGRFNLPCHLVDERLSSREARDIGRTMTERGGRRFDERRHIDSFAAQLLLESWFSDQG